jgi:hypothetical protein
MVIVSPAATSSDCHLIYSATELNIGIFCACAPVFYTLLKTWMQRAESAYVYLRQRLSLRERRKDEVVMAVEGSGVYRNPRRPRHNITGGTLVTLRSILHLARHDTARGADGSPEGAGYYSSQPSQFSALQSIDYDYAQICSDSPSGSETLLIGNKRQHGRGASRK